MPSGVLGPVDFWALAWFAAICFAEVMGVDSFCELRFSFTMGGSGPGLGSGVSGLFPGENSPDFAVTARRMQGLLWGRRDCGQAEAQPWISLLQVRLYISTPLIFGWSLDVVDNQYFDRTFT